MIREGKASDIPAIADIERTVFSDPWGEDAIAAHLTGTHLCLLVFEQEGRVCGYLLGAVIPPEGEIYRVAVVPQMRRCGAGRALCTAFLARAELCYLEVRRSNASARALYESLGFSLVGERRGYYKNPTEDACLYRR